MPPTVAWLLSKCARSRALITLCAQSLPLYSPRRQSRMMLRSDMLPGWGPHHSVRNVLRALDLEPTERFAMETPATKGELPQLR